MKSLMIVIALASATAFFAGAVSAEQSPPPSPDQSPTPATTGPSPEPGAAAPSSPPPAVRTPASPVASGPSSSDGAGRPVLVDAGSVIGTVVRNPEGKDIGKVSALLLDPHDGRVTSAVITVGGVLGMGGSTVSVPWNALRLGQDNHKLVVIMDQNTLEQAPSATPRTSTEPMKK